MAFQIQKSLEEMQGHIERDKVPMYALILCSGKQETKRSTGIMSALIPPIDFLVWLARNGSLAWGSVAGNPQTVCRLVALLDTKVLFLQNPTYPSICDVWVWQQQAFHRMSQQY